MKILKDEKRKKNIFSQMELAKWLWSDASHLWEYHCFIFLIKNNPNDLLVK